MARFEEFSTGIEQNASELEILAFWEREGVFDRLQEAREGATRFVFYEGPPTANGRPGVHHVMARAIKDVVCRYRSMRGHLVERKAGWDTHGLPVEIEVEKQLGLKSKPEIEQFGVEPFNRRCRESVQKYEGDWQELTRRMGYWLDMREPYRTFDNSYIETVWWILKRFWDEGLVYEGHKILPYCPRCGTPLSSHEVAQGYRDVEDPSVWVRFRDAGDPAVAFLVWTTTPWTLPSNTAIAVSAEAAYVEVELGGERLIVARERLASLGGEPRELRAIKGSELVGRRYLPLFDFFAGNRDKVAAYSTPTGEPGDVDRLYRVAAAGFVSMEDGTGIVHIAPAFGEDDYDLGRREGLPVLQPVDATGAFTADAGPWAGQFVKAADKGLSRDLKDRGLMWKQATVHHSYPHCWRCRSPLLYYARKSWYIATTRIRDRLVAAHSKVEWHPRDVGESRFANWVANNIDWALSRDRYWGTPLPVWRCGCGHLECLGSVAELREKGVKLPPDADLDLHKPQVDGYVYPCPECAGEMRRVPEVIDVWFDSGAMPFAQRHYPFENRELFKATFPADFISEGIDQSRGWFYSLLVIATFLEDQPAFRNVVPVEMILDKQGQRMHKSRGNAVDPFEMMAKEGADALRWYLLTASPTWLPTRFDRDGVTEVSRRFFATLRNTAQFFAMYANLEDYVPAGIGAHLAPGAPPLPEMDRWILARLEQVRAEVTGDLDRYEITRAARSLQGFVIDDLSNWYVRRSRRRFWKTAEALDHRAAFDTLHHVLVEVGKLLAPFAPFLAEEIHQKLARPAGATQPSVHLELLGEPDPRLAADELVAEMDGVLRVVSLARAAREQASLRVRQPLAELLAVPPRAADAKGLARWEQVIREEINVKTVRWLSESLGGRQAKPNFRTLGRKFGGAVNAVAGLIRTAHQDPARAAWLDAWAAGQAVTVSADGREAAVEPADVELVEMQPEGLSVASAGGWSVGVDTRLSPELVQEGIFREVAHLVQNLRRTAGLKVSDRIVLGIEAGEQVASAVRAHAGAVRAEVLATELLFEAVDGGAAEEGNLMGEPLRLSLRRAVSSGGAPGAPAAR